MRNYVTRKVGGKVLYRTLLGKNKWSWTDVKEFAYDFSTKCAARKAASRIPWPCEVVEEVSE